MEIKFNEFIKRRIAHWDKVAVNQLATHPTGRYYHHLLIKYYQFIVPKGRSVLEIGCGFGTLLNSLDPRLGVGVDISKKMIAHGKKKYPHLLFLHGDAHNIPLDCTFDVIILSDLINDLWDVQKVLEEIQGLCHPGTRIIINFFNNMWRIPLTLARLSGRGADILEQNWFSPHDVFNLLDLADFEVVKYIPSILLPIKISYISKLFNLVIAKLWPFHIFNLTNILVARPKPVKKEEVKQTTSVSIIVPARNEAGNIESIIKRIPQFGERQELIFVEGHSRDETYSEILKNIEKFPQAHIKAFQQQGEGKADAVRLGFDHATGDVLMILDADMTMPPEDLPRFYNALVSGKGEFINGVRLVYPMEDKAMRFFNILGNKFFSLTFSWLLGQPIKDTLCGTKVLFRQDYELLAANRDYFGDFDPFGDFDLLFGAAKLNLKIAEMPIRYRFRTYGTTNIQRWRHGMILLRMVLFAAQRIKFI